MFLPRKIPGLLGTLKVGSDTGVWVLEVLEAALPSPSSEVAGSEVAGSEVAALKWLDLPV